MRTSITRALFGVALALVAMPASAATFFDIVGVPNVGPRYRFSFSIPDGAVPNPTTSLSARFNGVPITYTRPGGTAEFVESGPFDGPTFLTTRDQGGVLLSRFEREPAGRMQFRLFGAQLFTGPTTAPVFTLGTFDLASTPRNSPRDPIQPVTYRVTIGDSPLSAVPEPATWAMMILGFGLTGVVLRRRARSMRVVNA